jgi:signal transduction histidine kinase
MQSLRLLSNWITWRSALLCAPLLLLIWMATSAFEDLRTHQQRVDSNDRVLALISALIQVHAALQEAESGQRAYLLTGKESYLTPFWNVKEKADESFRRMVPIVKVLQGGPGHLESIKKLTTAKLAEIQQSIDLYRSKGLAAALIIADADSAHQSMVQIRSEINAFAQEAYEANGRYRDASVRATTRTALIVAFGASTLFLLFAFATVLIERDHHRQHAYALRLQASATRIAELNQNLEFKVVQRTQALENANKELESFCYSVSHDLRAPLRSIEGFSKILTRDYDSTLDERAKDLTRRMSQSTLRMGQLIDDLLQLSKIGRASVEPSQVDLSELARSVARDLASQNPVHPMEVSIEPNVTARGDPRLLRVALENLFGNAWKFTKGQACPKLWFGQANSKEYYFVRDNGAGFDMAHAARLFVPFQRLHRDSEFEGTGIGLATVQRVIHSHAGRIWAEAQPGSGATFFFTIGSETQALLEQNESADSPVKSRRAAHG